MLDPLKGDKGEGLVPLMGMRARRLSATTSATSTVLVDRRVSS